MMAKIPLHRTPGQPWGRALRRTPAEIAELSRITPDDIDRAGKLFEKAAPKPLKKLLGKPKGKKSS